MIDNIIRLKHRCPDCKNELSRITRVRVTKEDDGIKYRNVSQGMKCFNCSYEYINTIKITEE